MHQVSAAHDMLSHVIHHSREQASTGCKVASGILHLRNIVSARRALQSIEAVHLSLEDRIELHPGLKKQPLQLNLSQPRSKLNSNVAVLFGTDTANLIQPSTVRMVSPTRSDFLPGCGGTGLARCIRCIPMPTCKVPPNSTRASGGTGVASRT